MDALAMGCTFRCVGQVTKREHQPKKDQNSKDYFRIGVAVVGGTFEFNVSPAVFASCPEIATVVIVTGHATLFANAATSNAGKGYVRQTVDLIADRIEQHFEAGGQSGQSGAGARPAAAARPV